jgi:hypothetical protein
LITDLLVGFQEEYNIFPQNMKLTMGMAQGVGDIGPRLGRHFSWTIFMYKKKYLIKYLHVRGGKN